MNNYTFIGYLDDTNESVLKHCSGVDVADAADNLAAALSYGDRFVVVEVLQGHVQSEIADQECCAALYDMVPVIEG